MGKLESKIHVNTYKVKGLPLSTESKGDDTKSEKVDRITFAFHLIEDKEKVAKADIKIQSAINLKKLTRKRAKAKKKEQSILGS